MRGLLLLAGTALAGVPAGGTGPAPAASAIAAAPASGAVPFPARLAQSAPITGPAAWTPIARGEVWRMLARDADRQPARWDHARSLIAQGLGAEAFGVLEVMRQDAPDLMLVDAYRIARGAARVLNGRPADAIGDLAPDLDGGNANPERCAWLLRALAGAGRPAAALRALTCAWPALTARRGPERLPFVLAGGRAAVAAGRPALALALLQVQPDRDPAANLIRAQALAATGQHARARLRLARIQVDAPLPLRQAARLAAIEVDVAEGRVSPAAATAALSALRYGWRGDDIEARALRLSYRLSRQRGDPAGAIAAGATLLRYHGDDPARTDGMLLPEVGMMTMGMANDPRVPLPRAAGLLWNYRDMLPVGQPGDASLRRLADRLQAAGLYHRAATLLDYQLFNRVTDVARGPLSARVAALFVLSGKPERAISVLRRTDDAGFTAGMMADRRRVEAVALDRLGRVGQALALLEQVPASESMRAEILWRARRWRQASEMLALVPPPLARDGRLTGVGQTIVLRRAITLGMLDRRDALAALYRRYAAAMKGTATAAVFDLLAGPAAAIDAAKLDRAMASLPGDSPTDAMAMLLEVEAAPDA